MGGTAGEVLDAAGPVGGAIIGSAAGGQILGPAGALLGGAAGAGAGGLSMPSDPFGAKAAQQQRQQAIEDIKNLEVTRDVNQDMTTTQEQTSTTELAKKSKTQEELEQSSLDNFLAQQEMVKSLEGDIEGRAALQNAGRGVLGDVASGQAFALSPEEQQRINALRQSEIDVGSQAVNQMLDQRLGELQANLAQRGVRGQAASQLQADTLGEATQSLERRMLAANQNAAQQALSMPGQRVGIQAQVGQGLADFQEQAKQQAITNRNQLQDPALLRALREENLATATKKSTGTTRQSGTVNTVSQGEGAAGAIATLAGGPSVQQENIATGAGAIGAIGKGVGGILGGLG